MKKICPYPFARMEFKNSHEFVPCCANWLTDEYFQLNSGSDPWNGPAAQALRQSLLDGTYKFCKTEQCHTEMVDPSVEDYKSVPEAPISSGNRRAILDEQTIMPEGPTSFSVLNDPRCNLACPSCRSSHILNIDRAAQIDLEKIDALISSKSKDLEVLKLSGDGEVFYSPWLRSLVKKINKEDFPKFRHIVILSNGLLFNEKTYKDLLPGSAFIRRVSISVDAGDSETYKKVRGGDWEKLVNNLKWIGELKQRKQIDYFQLNFTLRRENYHSLPEFIKLAKMVNATNVKITSFYDYDTSGIPNYAAEAIHLPDHPEHPELREVWQDYVKNDDFVFWSLPEPSPSRP